MSFGEPVDHESVLAAHVAGLGGVGIDNGVTIADFQRLGIQPAAYWGKQPACAYAPWRFVRKALTLSWMLFQWDSCWTETPPVFEQEIRRHLFERILAGHARSESVKLVSSLR